MKNIQEIYLKNFLFWSFKGLNKYYKAQNENFKYFKFISKQNRIKIIFLNDFINHSKKILFTKNEIHVSLSKQKIFEKCLKNKSIIYINLSKNKFLINLRQRLYIIKYKKITNSKYKDENFLIKKSIIFTIKVILLRFFRLLKKILNQIFFFKKKILNYIYLNNKKYLSYSQFRRLKIYNKKNLLDKLFRIEHYRLITNNFKNNNIGDIIDYFQKNENLLTIFKNSKQPKNIKFVSDFPRHCDDIFWNNGNSYFVNNIFYSFRNNIINYENINSMVDVSKKVYFSKKYYESKNVMNSEEIKNIFEIDPINIDHQFVLSGRHRVCAMIGRVIKNKDYIPIKINVE